MNTDPIQPKIKSMPNESIKAFNNSSITSSEEYLSEPEDCTLYQSLSDMRLEVIDHQTEKHYNKLLKRWSPDLSQQHISDDSKSSDNLESTIIGKGAYGSVDAVVIEDTKNPGKTSKEVARKIFFGSDWIFPTLTELMNNAQITKYINDNIQIIAQNYYECACRLVPCLSAIASPVFLEKTSDVLENLLLYIAPFIEHDEFLREYGNNETFEDYIMFPEFLLFKKVKGQDLSKILLDESKKYDLTSIQKFQILRDICQGLSLLHDAGILHRDLKPDNIMIKTNDDNSAKAYIIDLGLAVDMRNPGKFGEEYAIIDPWYCCPPEAYIATEEDRHMPAYNPNGSLNTQALYKPAYDIYGLGLQILPIMFGGEGWNFIYNCFYEIGKTGDQATNIEAREQLLEKIPIIVEGLNKNLKAPFLPATLDIIVSIMQQCLDPDPTKRPSARELAEKLTKTLGSIKSMEQTKHA